MSEFNKICDRPVPLPLYVWVLVLAWTGIVEAFCVLDILGLLQVRTSTSGLAIHALSYGVLWILGIGGIGWGSHRLGRRIHAHLRAQSELRASEELHRFILGSISDAVFVTDHGGKITYICPNVDVMFGSSLEEVQEMGNIGKLLGENLFDRTELETLGEIQNIEREITDKFGRKHTLLVNVKRVSSENGNVLFTCRDITGRKETEEELEAYKEQLEALVSDRTKKLTAVNQELEAFCYSVSHDLRAPLRGINEFSKALVEEYGDKLDVQGAEYLKRIQKATSRGGELIDDLLNLSRMSRSEMRDEKVNMSALAETVVEDIQQTEPKREVEFIIAPGLVVTGDTHLLKVVLENLVGNAWKFTGKAFHARIELGATEAEGQLAYFVRDNGAGFDMTYVDKLFHPFQRLHAANEFEGTGIGLATVKRIIRRHGGRVWAESTAGQGSTFYFTLEPANTWRFRTDGECEREVEVAEQEVPSNRG